MKNTLKIILIILVVIITAYSFVATIAATTFSTQLDELEVAYDELKEDYGEMELAFEAYKNDVALTRGLAYEFVFELVYREMILKEDYDLIAEIDKRTEQYKLTDDEKTSLLLWIDVLTEKYTEDN